MEIIDVRFVRRLNIALLVQDEIESGGERGAIKRFAEKVGTSSDHISAVLSEKTKAEVGDQLMRQIETAYKLDLGSLDFPSGMHRTIMQSMIIPDEKRQSSFDFTEHLYSSTDAQIFSTPERIGKYLKALTKIIESKKPAKLPTKK